MIPFHMLRTAKNEIQLMVGDVVVLERLLPRQPSIKKLNRERDIQLSELEHKALLTALQKIDLKSLGDEEYPRTSLALPLLMHKTVALVTELIEWLSE